MARPKRSTSEVKGVGKLIEPTEARAEKEGAAAPVLVDPRILSLATLRLLFLDLANRGLADEAWTVEEEITRREAGESSEAR
jgi:hypothetical protein